jgi:hypothetical protein
VSELVEEGKAKDMEITLLTDRLRMLEARLATTESKGTSSDSNNSTFSADDDDGSLRSGYVLTEYKTKVQGISTLWFVALRRLSTREGRTVSYIVSLLNRRETRC